MSLRVFNEVESFDAFIGRLAGLIRLVVIVSITGILCFILASVLFTYEINGYTSHVQIVKYNL